MTDTLRHGCKGQQRAANYVQDAAENIIVTKTAILGKRFNIFNDTLHRCSELGCCICLKVFCRLATSYQMQTHHCNYLFQINFQTTIHRYGIFRSFAESKARNNAQNVAKSYFIVSFFIPCESIHINTIHGSIHSIVILIQLLLITIHASNCNYNCIFELLLFELLVTVIAVYVNVTVIGLVV